jgi:hypothetical protein
MLSQSLRCEICRRTVQCCVMLVAALLFEATAEGHKKVVLTSKQSELCCESMLCIHLDTKSCMLVLPARTLCEYNDAPALGSMLCISCITRTVPHFYTNGHSLDVAAAALTEYRIPRAIRASRQQGPFSDKRIHAYFGEECG